MRVLTALGAGLVMAELVGLRFPARAGRVGAVGAVGVVSPTLAVVGTAALLVGARYRRMARGRAEQQAARADVTLLGELVGMGLGAGLTFVTALETAGAEVHPGLAAEVDGVLRRARRHGLAVALDGEAGLAGSLYRVAARAVTSGAPVAAAVDAFVEDAHAEERARLLASARRLPIRLLLPLALLILPGFVILTVGPTLLAALERFRFPGS